MCESVAFAGASLGTARRVGGCELLLRPTHVSCLSSRPLVHSASRRCTPPRAGLFDEQGTSKDNVDWDASWKQFSAKSTTEKEREGEDTKGGVFKLSERPNPARLGNTTDPKTTRLTDAWTSESGYLVGIGICLALAGFVAYTWSQSQSAVY
jgi:hypothetical protein